MTNKLYKLMDWAAIEGIVYSEEDQPQNILGVHPVTGGNLVQMFYPEAIEATLHTKNKEYAMEMADDAGFFAVLIPKTVSLDKYSFSVKIWLKYTNIDDKIVSVQICVVQIFFIGGWKS